MSRIAERVFNGDAHGIPCDQAGVAGMTSKADPTPLPGRSAAADLHMEAIAVYRSPLLTRRLTSQQHQGTAGNRALLRRHKWLGPDCALHLFANAGCDSIEAASNVLAKVRDPGSDYHCNERRDQTIFDRRGPIFVFEELLQLLHHGSALLSVRHGRLSRIAHAKETVMRGCTEFFRI
jgi:hypothetical protein